MSRIAGTISQSRLKSIFGAADEIRSSDQYLLGTGATTVAALLGNAKKSARSRQDIYGKWEEMESDAIVSTALTLLITAALGGHETSGDLVFIEPTADAQKDKRLTKIVEEIASAIGPKLNEIAIQTAYQAATFGDSYVRIYTEDKAGVVDLYADELVRPPLVQPFERGSRTAGYVVYTGERAFQRLSIGQMARCKMPRTQWVPQMGVVEKAMRLAITEDRIDQLPLIPAMAGGSLLFPAERAYDDLSSALLGLVGQRWMDAIDEQIITFNVDSMTPEQRTLFMQSITSIFKASKERAESAAKSARPVMERVRHILPVFADKQMLTVGQREQGRASTITVDDVMLHAKLLAGAIGVDLSMIGFADQLSGGLGEGGFFRTSAQVAERSRVIRVALSKVFCDIIDVHTMHKYGAVFEPNNRPWMINFFGSISAMEAERQRTRLDAANAGLLLIQGMQQLRDMGADKTIMTDFLIKEMMLDADQAELYAQIVDADSGGGESGPV